MFSREKYNFQKQTSVIYPGIKEDVNLHFLSRTDSSAGTFVASRAYRREDPEVITEKIIAAAKAPAKDIFVSEVKKS